MEKCILREKERGWVHVNSIYLKMAFSSSIIHSVFGSQKGHKGEWTMKGGKQ